MAESRELLASLFFNVDTKELEKGENALLEFAEKIKKFAGAAVAVFAGKEIFEFAESEARAMTAIERTATQLGISTDKVQEFQFAAKKLGMDADQLTGLMGRLQVAQQGAAAGSKQGEGAFKKLGVSVKDSNGHFKSADVLFTDVAEGIHNLKDPSQQAALATQLFGRQGRQLLPILKEGREGVEGITEEFRALGGGYSEKAIAASKKFEASQARLGLVWTSIKSKVFPYLLKALSWLVEKFTTISKVANKLLADSQLVETILYTLGTAATVFGAKFMIAWLQAAAVPLLVAAAIFAVILLINSIIRMFQGKQSFVKDWLDQIFGKGQTTEFIDKLKAAWESAGRAIEKAKNQAKAFFSFAKGIWNFKVTDFVEDLLGDQDEADAKWGGEVEQAIARKNGNVPAVQSSQPPSIRTSSGGTNNVSTGGNNVTINVSGSVDKDSLPKLQSTIDDAFNQQTSQVMSAVQRAGQ